ncbi:hypothetical protein J6590_064207 [Homalodisca vitripennis]|nr:hypothetical protein J6590_064207 [Homalodisca vitripennis]
MSSHSGITYSLEHTAGEVCNIGARLCCGYCSRSRTALRPSRRCPASIDSLLTNHPQCTSAGEHNHNAEATAQWSHLQYALPTTTALTSCRRDVTSEVEINALTTSNHVNTALNGCRRSNTRVLVSFLFQWRGHRVSRVALGSRVATGSTREDMHGDIPVLHPCRHDYRGFWPSRRRPDRYVLLSAGALRQINSGVVPSPSTRSATTLSTLGERSAARSLEKSPELT